VALAYTGVSSPVAEIRASPARERILRTVDRLFYGEGIHAVGINRVVEEAGVTRATLYRHFPSKDALIDAYLAERAEAGKAGLQRVLEEHPDDPRGALSAMGAESAANALDAEPLGCPFIRAFAEFSDPRHPTRTGAVRQRAWILAAVEGLLEQLGADDPRRGARQLLMLRTGLVFGGALDGTDGLGQDFLAAWEATVDAALA
jgi:AcrR family transcriptional regulator